MSETRRAALSLGPVYYLWDGPKWRDFYFRIADEADIEHVTLGETVCSKRQHFSEPHVAEVIERAAARHLAAMRTGSKAGEQVMVSRISRILVVLCMGGVLAACSSASYVRTDKQPPGSASRSSSTAPATSSISGPSYRVAKGDTMYGIAFRNGLDFRDLARWNNIESPYTIYVGQMLRLGPASGSMASTLTCERLR